MTTQQWIIFILLITTTSFMLGSIADNIQYLSKSVREYIELYKKGLKDD